MKLELLFSVCHVITFLTIFALIVRLGIYFISGMPLPLLIGLAILFTVLSIMINKHKSFLGDKNGN